MALLRLARATKLALVLVYCALPVLRTFTISPASAAEALNGLSLTCAHILTLPGDGMVHIRDSTAASHPVTDEILAAVDALPLNSTYPLPTNQIEGATIDVLERIRAMAADTHGAVFNISYVYYKVNANLSTTLPVLIDAISKFDCIVSAVAITPESVPFLDFMVPHIPFGFQVMTPVPLTQTLPLSERIYFFLKPFSPALWATIGALILVSTVFIGVTEGGKEPPSRRGMMQAAGRTPEPYDKRPGVNENEFVWHDWRRSRDAEDAALGIPVHPRTLADRTYAVLHDQFDRFTYSLFRSFTIMFQGEGIQARTVAGRAYLAGFGFCFLVVTATYTANLAAVMTVNSMSVQTINSIQDFYTQNLVLCVRNTSIHLAFLRTNYPQIRVLVTDPTERALAQAILSGQCAGAVSTSVHLKYFLNTDQLGCQLQITGQQLNMGYYAIPFRPGSWGNASIPSAMSLLLSDLISSGSLGTLLEESFPTTSKLPCVNARSVQGPIQQMEVPDLAGIFVFQAFIALAAAIIYFATATWRQHGSKVLAWFYPDQAPGTMVATLNPLSIHTRSSETSTCVPDKELRDVLAQLQSQMQAAQETLADCSQRILLSEKQDKRPDSVAVKITAANGSCTVEQRHPGGVSPVVEGASHGPGPEVTQPSHRSEAGAA